MSEVKLSSKKLEQLAEALEAKLGLHFPPDRSKDLERGLHRLQKKANFPTLEAVCEAVLSGRPSLEDSLVATCFTIGETYFFRDPVVFNGLGEWLTRWGGSLEQANRFPKIWCAACSTGEEAYTIACLLHKHLAGATHAGPLVQATDLNQDSLKTARNAVYGKWSFRDCPKGFREANFEALDDGRWRVRKRIAQAVTFREFNLAGPSYPQEQYDIVFCRNVLMYFHESLAKKIVNQLLECVRPGGLFLVAAAEAWMVEGCSVWTWGAGSFRKPLSADTDVEPSYSDLQAWVSQAPSPGLEPEPPVHATEFISDESASGLLDKASEAFHRGERQLSLDYCDQVIAQDSHNPKPFQLKARILDLQGDYHGALFALNHALFLQPDNFSDAFLMGTVQEKLGNKRGALASFKRARDLLKGAHHGSEAEWLHQTLDSKIAKLYE